MGLTTTRTMELGVYHVELGSISYQDGAIKPVGIDLINDQREFQDPEMKVLNHIRP